MKRKKLGIIGRNTVVEFVGHARGVAAKVDTGADSSSVWATNIRINPEGDLQFILFDEGSPHYTGEIITRKDYTVAVVRSATGHEQIRYRVRFSLRIHRKKVLALFNLSDRSKNIFPVLIGRRTLKNKFVVDVTRADVAREEKVFSDENRVLSNELAKDPQAFYKKYFGKNIDKIGED